jgi:energy-coupling factor transporter ATP-binding protein EcfA2
MNIKRLQIASLRVFEHAEFEFRPGMNLLVGVNGVGKSTVLDALRICLSKYLLELNSVFTPWLRFVHDDIRATSRSLMVRVFFEANDCNFECHVHKQREASVAHKPGSVPKQTLATPDAYGLTLLDGKRTPNEEPYLALFYSTRRSLVSGDKSRSAKAAGGLSGVLADALHGGELKLAEVAFWMRAQEEIAGERPLARKHVAALRRAVARFLPEFRNLRAQTSPRPTLFLEKNRITLDVGQLSEGERGLLAIVLDIARRLSQANPSLADPIKQGKAVVLIDELDLHLHPKWQRTIVEQLTRTFPRCQFIATTHSPQIVAAVEPEQVLLLTDTGVVQPDRTLGMDSNWILRHLMQADDRPVRAGQAIRGVEALIKKGSFIRARTAIAEAKKKGLDLPEWSVLEARMARLEVLSK